jgi:RHS repeat-associated protein
MKPRALGPHNFLGDIVVSCPTRFARTLPRQRAHPRLTTLTYDFHGRLQTITDPLGRVTTYEYDAETGDLVSQTLPDGDVIGFEHDSMGNEVALRARPHPALRATLPCRGQERVKVRKPWRFALLTGSGSGAWAVRENEALGRLTDGACDGGDETSEAGRRGLQSTRDGGEAGGGAAAAAAFDRDGACGVGASPRSPARWAEVLKAAGDRGICGGLLLRRARDRDRTRRRRPRPAWHGGGRRGTVSGIAATGRQGGENSQQSRVDRVDSTRYRSGALKPLKPHEPSRVKPLSRALAGEGSAKPGVGIRGSVRLVVNAETGEIGQRFDYGPYGEVLADTDPRPKRTPQPFGFAGGEYDAETGLVRFGVRDYDAGIGRWTSKDPILWDGGLTLLYGYVGGDPVNATDVGGMQAAAERARAATSLELTRRLASVGTLVSDYVPPREAERGVVSGPRVIDSAAALSLTQRFFDQSPRAAQLSASNDLARLLHLTLSEGTVRGLIGAALDSEAARDWDLRLTRVPQPNIDIEITGAELTVWIGFETEVAFRAERYGNEIFPAMKGLSIGLRLGLEESGGGLRVRLLPIEAAQGYGESREASSTAGRVTGGNVNWLRPDVAIEGGHAIGLTGEPKIGDLSSALCWVFGGEALIVEKLRGAVSEMVQQAILPLMDATLRRAVRTQTVGFDAPGAAFVARSPEELAANVCSELTSITLDPTIRDDLAMCHPGLDAVCGDRGDRDQFASEGAGAGVFAQRDVIDLNVETEPSRPVSGPRSPAWRVAMCGELQAAHSAAVSDLENPANQPLHSLASNPVTVQLTLEQTLALGSGVIGAPPSAIGLAFAPRYGVVPTYPAFRQWGDDQGSLVRMPRQTSSGSLAPVELSRSVQVEASINSINKALSAAWSAGQFDFLIPFVDLGLDQVVRENFEGIGDCFVGNDLYLVIGSSMPPVAHGYDASRGGILLSWGAIDATVCSVIPSAAAAANGRNADLAVLLDALLYQPMQFGAELLIRDDVMLQTRSNATVAELAVVGTELKELYVDGGSAAPFGETGVAARELRERVKSILTQSEFWDSMFVGFALAQTLPQLDGAELVPTTDDPHSLSAGGGFRRFAVGNGDTVRDLGSEYGEADLGVQFGYSANYEIR